MLSAPHAFTLQWLLLAIHSFNGSTSVQTVQWSTILHTPQSTFFTPDLCKLLILCKHHMYIVQTAYLVHTTHALCKLLSVWFFLSTALDLFCCSASLAKPAKELESSRFTIFTLISKQHHENHHFHQRLSNQALW